MLNVNRELIDLCIRKNRRAQNKLYELCFGILMSICLRYEKNEEDARYMLNVGFMKIITNLTKFTDEMTFEYWMRRIMINTLIDEYRKKKKINEHFVNAELDSNYHVVSLTSWNSAELKFQAEELEIMIRQLPSDTQNVFNLFAIDGYSHKEISEKMSMPVGTTKWHVSKARDILGKLIAEKSNKIKVRTS
jgi:RNA polymerase sigma-70 factor (ECF subfamily)